MHISLGLVLSVTQSEWVLSVTLFLKSLDSLQEFTSIFQCIYVTELAIFHYWGLLQLSKGVVTTVKKWNKNESIKSDTQTIKNVIVSKYQISVSSFFCGQIIEQVLCWLFRRFSVPRQWFFVAALGGALQVEIWSQGRSVRSCVSRPVEGSV